MTNTKYNEAGRSMIEMLGVLAIIGVLSVGGIAGYSKAMNKYRVNKTVDEITQIATNIRTLFGGQRNYESLTAAVVDGAKLVPEEMYTNASASGMTYANPWSEDLTITVTSKTSADTNKAFTIKSEKIPTEACIELAVMDWGAASGSGLVAMSAGVDLDAANSTATIDSCTSGDGLICPDNNGPMTPADAVKFCVRSKDADGTQDMYWKFY